MDKGRSLKEWKRVAKRLSIEELVEKNMPRISSINKVLRVIKKLEAKQETVTMGRIVTEAKKIGLSSLQTKTAIKLLNENGDIVWRLNTR